MSKDIILNNVSVTETGCWEWIKSCNSTGYGQTTINKKYVTTHRLAYKLFNGELKSFEVVRHKCHNTRCCNPEHLIKGSAKDNYNDSREKYLEAAVKRRTFIVIGSKVYPSIRKANKITKITFSSLVKFREGNVFNISRYREGCRIANVVPKI